MTWKTMEPTDQEQIHVMIEGHVQGVGFRYYVLEKASELGITGWVRNTIQGDVEVLAEASREQLDKFIELLKEGPRLAVITKFDIQKNKYSGEFFGFSLRNTA